MQFAHTGLRISTIHACDAFFEQLLGLQISRVYTVPSDLMKELFGIDEEYNVRIYDVGEQKFEVFIDPEKGSIRKDRELEQVGQEGAEREMGERMDPGGIAQISSVSHVCLKVDDREDLIKRAMDLEFRVYEWEREGKPNIVFIYDRDGNAYELVE